MNSSYRNFCSLALAAALCSCAVGPDFVCNGAGNGLDAQHALGLSAELVVVDHVL